jgi:tRNA U54 and U55 pseudouridine synthase Pus10
LKAIRRVDDWYDEVARQLRRYHIAGFLVGADAKTLSEAAQKAVAADIKTQLSFLKQFRVEIQDSAEWQRLERALDVR